MQCFLDVCKYLSVLNVVIVSSEMSGTTHYISKMTYTHIYRHVCMYTNIKTDISELLIEYTQASMATKRSESVTVLCGCRERSYLSQCW